MKLISRLSDRERLFFLLTLSIIVVFLVYNFLLNPLSQQIDELDTSIITIRTELGDSMAVMQSEKKINKEREIYIKYLEKEEAPEVKLQGTINMLAVQSGLTINEIKPVRSVDKTKTFVELVAEGKIEGLVQFLYNLGIVQSLLKVEKVDLVAKAPKSDIIKMSVVVSRTIVE